MGISAMILSDGVSDDGSTDDGTESDSKLCGTERWRGVWTLLTIVFVIKDKRKWGKVLHTF